MIVPAEHKETIAALVKADPEVAQATCDIPHLDPGDYLYGSLDADDEDFNEELDSLPYCGCFVGVYAWMWACKREKEVNLWDFIPGTVSSDSGINMSDINEFGGWCTSVEADQAAVRYARSLLATREENAT